MICILNFQSIPRLRDIRSVFRHALLVNNIIANDLAAHSRTQLPPHFIDIYQTLYIRDLPVPKNVEDMF
jgi:hypothetical protein